MFSWVFYLTASSIPLLCLSSPALSQSAETGIILGTVVDQQGRAIGGARVIVNDLSTTLERFQVETESDGRYKQTGLASGLYTITAEKAELGSEVFRVRIRSGRTVGVNFALEPGRYVATWLSDAVQRQELSLIFSAGVDANREGDFKAAVERFNQTLGLSARCVGCYFNLAVAYTELGRFAEAELAFRQAIEIKPDYAAAYYGLANIYRKQNQTENTMAAHEEAIRITLTQLEAGRSQAKDEVSLGIALLDTDNAVDAQRLFEAAIKNARNYGPAYYWLGLSLLRQNQPDAAMLEFRRYLGIEPAGEFAAQTRKQLNRLGR